MVNVKGHEVSVRYHEWQSNFKKLLSDESYIKKPQFLPKSCG